MYLLYAKSSHITEGALFWKCRLKHGHFAKAWNKIMYEEKLFVD